MGVTDGDTLKVLRGKEQVKVRLYGIDAPEKKQAFGQKAKEFTTGLAAGKDVEVDENAHDRYGRTVGVVTLPDGKNLNLEVVRSGLAWWYRAYAKGESAYKAAEDEARAASRGLWADKAPMPPWEWRRAQKGR